MTTSPDPRQLAEEALAGLKENGGVFCQECALDKHIEPLAQAVLELLEGKSDSDNCVVAVTAWQDEAKLLRRERDALRAENEKLRRLPNTEQSESI